MLARDGMQWVEGIEVNQRRVLMSGIAPPNQNLVFFEFDSLNCLFALLNIQKGVDFCALWYHQPDTESGPDHGLLALRQFLIGTGRRGTHLAGPAWPRFDQGLLLFFQYLIYAGRCTHLAEPDWKCFHHSKQTGRVFRSLQRVIAIQFRQRRKHLAIAHE